MSILRTARVALVEDDDKEAMPLLLALAKMGIGAWHFNGDIEKLPLSPLTGVRIVFLDLRLGSTGPSAEGRNTYAQTVAVLEKLVGDSKGSVGIVYWTKNEEEIEDFEARLKEELPGFTPTFVHRIESKQKLLAFTLNDNDTGPILAKLNEVMQQRAAHHLLLEWEQCVHDAASVTTNLLAEVADGEEGDSHECLLQVLSALSYSAGATANGKVDGAIAVTKLFEALNPIHFDHLEQLAFRREANDAHSRALHEELEKNKDDFKKRKGLSKDTKARINGAFLTARIGAEDPPFQPGAVYLPNVSIGNRCPHFHVNIDLSRIAEEILQLTKDQHFNREFQRNNDSKLKSNDRDSAMDSARKRAAEIFGDCHKFLIEISPACDFAQSKRKTARFVGGLLVPEKHIDLIKVSQSLKPVEPVYLSQLEGTWQPIISSLYIFGLSAFEKRVDSLPTFRLRNPVVVDILAWLSSQSARPGYMSLP
jgi:hypothetical protein